MAQGNDQEKTEQATPKKREDARKKGQIAHSREIPSVMVLLSALMVFYFGGSWMLGQMSEIMISTFHQLFQSDFQIETAHGLLRVLFSKIFLLLAPLVTAVAVAGIFSNVIQTGFLITGETLSPKFDKLNPINGLKRLVSTRALVEVVKAIMKVIIIGTMAYIMLRDEMDQIPALVQLSTGDILNFIGQISMKMGFYTCLVLAVLAGVDFLFQQYQHGRDLRMTKQEVKDEHKQREGDPMVKSRIRAIQREMAMQRMMEAVPDATVVITNPTHLAIALKFDSSMPAPQVVAKGAGVIAERIRAIAGEHDIPIIEQKPLARALYKSVEIEQYIPADLYHAIAEVLAYVYRLKGLVHE